jgi:hypothetical protein
MADRAAVDARILLQIVAHHIRSDSGDSLHQQIADYLRGAFEEITRATLNEIRREDE